MKDKNLNPLRLLMGLGIVAYFAWLFIQPNPNQQPEGPATQVPPQTTTQPSPAPKAEPVADTCPGQIEQVGLGTNEIRLRVTGAASTILVYTDQGNVTASTTEAGSGGEYRVRTPGPATAVQLDNCTPLNLR
ncbi:MAG: hypothetical protein N2318_13255 [Meiothermus sp.]|nr:hypothetical protein [Meiothermus sp.]